jgi:hypothetical protein
MSSSDVVKYINMHTRIHIHTYMCSCITYPSNKITDTSPYQQLNSRLNYANPFGKLELYKDTVAAYQKVLEMPPSHEDALNKTAFFARCKRFVVLLR